ncbi:MAG: hypothetical protein M1818_002979 [Claussenomyces sp. TS43310]|nr:MAG: hypothetical protein M1818_002979 [Claussenomyces sp. TS43310]
MEPDQAEIAPQAADDKARKHGSGFFDLQPPSSLPPTAKTEELMKRLFSDEHLHFILEDHALFWRLSLFVNRYKPQLAPALVRYLELRKALKAIEYANAIVRKIKWTAQSDRRRLSQQVAASVDSKFDDNMSRDLKLLCAEILPAFVTHDLVNIVVDCVSRDITGRSVPAMHDLVGNLGEVFCLTDPSLPDNPIIYASEEFHRTTQYGTSYAIDRNCRFLQGPHSDKECVRRMSQAITEGREFCETLLNYRRDGTPFINLLMCTPLLDDQGQVRYFLGAQVDVTRLVQEGRGIESFRALLSRGEQVSAPMHCQTPNVSPKSSRPLSGVDKSQETLQKLKELSLMFSQEEADVVNRNSRGAADSSTDASSISNGFSGSSTKSRAQSRRVIGREPPLMDEGHLAQLTTQPTVPMFSLPGVYQQYLLVRPYPSLQIMFVSPTLRIPGLLRANLFSKIGGPQSTLSALSDAFREGAPTTVKVLWLPKGAENERMRRPTEARSRWIRCTPLLGSDDRVGVWIIIHVPLDSNQGEDTHEESFTFAPKEVVAKDVIQEEQDMFGGYSFAARRHTGSSTASVRPSSGYARSMNNDDRLDRQRKGSRGRKEMVTSDELDMYASYLRSSSSAVVNGGENELVGVR